MALNLSLTLGVAGIAAAVAAHSVLAASSGTTGNVSAGAPVRCERSFVFDRAKGRCVSVRALDDGDLYEEGRALALAGHYGNALDALLAIRQADSRVLTMIGFAQRKSGDFAKAIAYYERSLALDPNNAETREYLGEGYAEAGKLELAQRELARIEQICGGRDCEEYRDLASAIAAKAGD